MRSLPSRTAPEPRARRRHRHTLHALAAILLVATAATGAVTLTYSTSSTNTLNLKDPPIQWASGPDSSGNNFVASFSLSTNKTFYTVTLKPVPEANVTWGNFSSLKNVASESYSVTVTGTSVSSNAKILDFKLEFRNYGTDAVVATLNLKDASPTTGAFTMAASANHYVKMYIKLDTGTGAADIPASVTLSLTIS